MVCMAGPFSIRGLQGHNGLRGLPATHYYMLALSPLATSYMDFEQGTAFDSIMQ